MKLIPAAVAAALLLASGSTFAATEHHQPPAGSSATGQVPGASEVGQASPTQPGAASEQPTTSSTQPGMIETCMAMMSSGGMMPMMGMMGGQPGTPGGTVMGQGGQGSMTGPGTTMGPGGGAGSPGMPGMGMVGMDMPGTAMIERVEGRIAFLRAELKISDAQLPAWNEFADALRANAKRVNEFHRAGMAPVPTTLGERLERQDKWLADRLDSVRAFRAAYAKLAATLNDEQKRTFEELVPPHMGVM